MLPTGLSKKEVRSMVLSGIDTCKQLAKEQGTHNLPKNYGDLLVQAALDEKPGSMHIVNRALHDGATYFDIQQFWNLPDLARRMVLWHKDVFRAANFYSFMNDHGMSATDAMKEVRKMFPMYGDPTDETHTSGDDRPLSYELMDRVAFFDEKIGAENIRIMVSKHTTYNSFVRVMIRTGNI